MNPLIKICKHAINDINRQLKDYQEKIILKERWEQAAVFDPMFYKAGDQKHAEMLWSDLEDKYADLNVFAMALQRLIEAEDDKAFKRDLEAFLASY